jgi:porin
MKKIFRSLLPCFFFLAGFLGSVSLCAQQSGSFSYISSGGISLSQNDTIHHKTKSWSKRGVTFGTTGSLEGYYNFAGGIQTGSAFSALLDANMNVDLEKLLGWKRGTFYVDFEYHGGDNPTSKLVGDLQVFDKNNADPFFETLEIWYQQLLFDKKLRIKLGKVDANTEFSVIDNGLGFINSPTQVTPAFPVFPTFPDPMPGITLFFNPNHLFFADFALYQANQSTHFLNFYGDPSSAQMSLHGQLFIVESGLNWDQLPWLNHSGNFKLGVWKHNGYFDDFSGGREHGLSGIYLIFDQTLWKSLQKNDQRSVRMFLEYGLTDAKVSAIYRHYGGGVVLTAPFRARPDDEMGLSIQNADISSGLQVPQKYELDFEGYYQFSLVKGINFKPDFQYVVHPGGVYHNAFVSTFMLNYSFPADNGN